MSVQSDKTEEIRRHRLTAIHSEVESTDPTTERLRLEAQHGQVWDTTQLAADFEVLSFMAPYAVVKRK